MISAVRIAIAVHLAACFVPTAIVAQPNLTGRWRVDSPPIDFLQIEQSGSTLSVTANFPGVGDLVFSGDAADPFQLDCSGDPECPPPTAYLVGRSSADGNTILGALYYEVGDGVFFATRCECDDGNSDDGDGCGSDCRIEECFACSGQPSVCTPLGDGQACDDGFDCSVGETCNSGVCGGGSAASPPCIDMTGTWNVRTYVPDFDVDIDDVWEVSQHAGNLVVRDQSGVARDMGTIDVQTGTVELVGGPLDIYGFALCPNAFPGASHLVVDASVGTLSGETVLVVPTVTHCLAFSGVVTGARDGAATCGDGVVTPPEQCDDGNLAAGDCCAANCMNEADGARCVQVCGVCSGGVCAPGPLPNQACTECADGDGCSPARLLIRDSAAEDRDAFLWKWPGAGEISAASLAIPSGTSGYEVCVYDQVSATPSLLVAARVGEDASCRGGSCWRALGDPPGSGGLRFRDRHFTPGGIVKMDLLPGEAGEAKIVVRGHGADLEVDGALPLSQSSALRAEVRAPNGSCWRSTFGAANATRNDAGLFKGRSD